MMSQHLPPIEMLLPHRGTMLLLDAVTAWDAESATSSASVRADSWYAADNGSMPSWIGIELMAQTIAAHVGLSARSRGLLPKQGILLGTRAYQATMSDFPTGALLRVNASLIFRDTSGLGAYACSISLDDNHVASATLKVYEPEDFDAFLMQTSNRS
ncbi:MAG: hotdog family protein [Gammaproteobacteria bacterium]|jgi:predicted hotdog family 3-hydroxylacyl-ACP dehydratase